MFLCPVALLKILLNGSKDLVIIEQFLHVFSALAGSCAVGSDILFFGKSFFDLLHIRIYQRGPLHQFGCDPVK